MKIDNKKDRYYEINQNILVRDGHSFNKKWILKKQERKRELLAQKKVHNQAFLPPSIKQTLSLTNNALYKEKLTVYSMNERKQNEL